MSEGPYRYLIASIREAYTPTSEEIFLSLKPFPAFLLLLTCLDCSRYFLKCHRHESGESPDLVVFHLFDLLIFEGSLFKLSVLYFEFVHFLPERDEFVRELD